MKMWVERKGIALCERYSKVGYEVLGALEVLEEAAIDPQNCCGM